MQKNLKPTQDKKITSDQALAKAINIAEKNGWKFNEEWLNGCIADSCDNEILFNHGIAKGFWGEDIVCEICGDEGCYLHTVKEKQIGLPNYIFHLKQMVCCGWDEKDTIGTPYPKEPLKYIKRFL